MKTNFLKIVLKKQDDDLISYREDGTYEDCKTILETLSKQEFYWFGGRFINSPNTCYRLIAYYNKTLPIGFIEAYDFTKDNHSIVIVLAVDKNFRSKGIAITLINRLVMNALTHKIKTKDKLYAIISNIHRDNIASIRCIEKTKLFIRNDLNDRINSKEILYLKYIENYGKGPKYKMPYDLNKYLNDFRWGCVYNNKVHTEWQEECTQKYKTISLGEFEKLKAGCCWDYVNFEAEYFKKHYIFKPICYYAEDNNYQTHTWLTFWDDNTLWVFESSWKDCKGLLPFTTEKEMFKTYSFKLLDNWKKDMSDSKGIKIYQYEAGEDMIGLTYMEFMKKCKSSKPIYVK